MDREIEDALRRVCELLGIDMAVLWQWLAAAPALSSPPTPTPTRQDLAGSEPAGARITTPGACQQMLTGRMLAIASAGRTASTRPPSIARAHAKLGIKSSLILPLSVGGEPPVGALALNTLRAEREWPDALVKRLQLVAQVFTNALARKRADEALRGAEARLAAGADLAGLAFYEVDLGRGRRLRRRPVSRHLRASRRNGHRASSRSSSGWSTCTPTIARACWTRASSCTTGGCDGSPIEYRYLHPVAGERWIHHLARRRRARRRRARDPHVRRPPRHHGAASAPRRSCAA